MRTRILARSAAIGSLLWLVACTGSTDFSITKSFDVTATGGAVYAPTAVVNLPQDAPDGWKHRSKIKSLDLLEISGTMTQNVSQVATTGSGSIKLRADGAPSDGSQDVTVGSWASEPIPLAAPHSIGVVLQPDAAGVIENALKGTGIFTVIMTGTTAASVHFTADVTLHLKMKFKVP